MSTSILTSIKKALNIPDDTAFDTDVIMHINSVLSTLHQLGIGPPEGFRIDDATATWSQLLNDDDRLNNVKSYIYLRVRLLFDPPGTSFHLESLTVQKTELEWRINAQREDQEWTEPTP